MCSLHFSPTITYSFPQQRVTTTKGDHNQGWPQNAPRAGPPASSLSWRPDPKGIRWDMVGQPVACITTIMAYECTTRIVVCSMTIQERGPTTILNHSYGFAWKLDAFYQMVAKQEHCSPSNAANRWAICSLVPPPLQDITGGYAHNCWFHDHLWWRIPPLLIQWSNSQASTMVVYFTFTFWPRRRRLQCRRPRCGKIQVTWIWI